MEVAEARGDGTHGAGRAMPASAGARAARIAERGWNRSLISCQWRAKRISSSGPGLAVPAHDPFVGREPFQRDGPARMHAASRDADLGAKAELAAIGKLAWRRSTSRWRCRTC